MDVELSLTDISLRLRSIRLAKSLSLAEVEKLSNGRIKAVVLGSYERGARTLSVKRAIAIADIYQIPLSHLLSAQPPIEIIGEKRIVIDLRKVNRRSQDLHHLEQGRYQSLARFAQRLIYCRQDWNGEVLSIRYSDVETISLVIDTTIEKTLYWLESEKILLARR